MEMVCQFLLVVHRGEDDAPDAREQIGHSSDPRDDDRQPQSESLRHDSRPGIGADRECEGVGTGQDAERVWLMEMAVPGDKRLDAEGPGEFGKVAAAGAVTHDVDDGIPTWLALPQSPDGPEEHVDPLAGYDAAQRGHPPTFGIRRGGGVEEIAWVGTAGVEMDPTALGRNAIDLNGIALTGR